MCTNGLVIARAGGTLFEQKHIGISAEEFHEGLAKSLMSVDILTENAVELIKVAKKTKNRYDINSLTEEEFNEFADYIKAKTNISTENSSKVISLMQTKYDNSKWGLINGITEVAQDFTLERRLELERIAGNLLTA